MPVNAARSRKRPLEANAARRFDSVSITFHWTTAVLIAGLLTTGWLMGSATHAAEAEKLLYAHRSLGALGLVVAICRLLWRLTFAFLPPWPTAMPRIQRVLARANEYGLYALLLAQPVTGLAQSLARGRPFPLLAWQVPPVMAKDKALTTFFHDIHEVSALILLGLIAIHILAALFHRLVLRDEVLQSMLPWQTSREPSQTLPTAGHHLKRS